MPTSPYAPIFELTRGCAVESIHNGAVAVMDISGNLLAWYGDPQAVTFLRSTAKPFQAMPFIEQMGHQLFGLSVDEIALMCASHSGTDAHLATARSIQAKAGIDESELLCGVHPPIDDQTAEMLRQRKEPLTSNRHNCSGKHSGMLAFTRLKQRAGQPAPGDLAYIDPAHPIQKEILESFAQMCGLPVEQIKVGIDGCSAPNFAIPLCNTALGYARLCDPENGGVEPAARRLACHTITAAMRSRPDMVGGPGRFDTCLMQVGQGRIVSKGGADGYQGIGLMPGALGPGSPALGIALKIGDGDSRQMVGAAVALEVLRQLEALSPADLDALSRFGPRTTRFNWRKVPIGEAYPIFELNQITASNRQVMEAAR